MSIMCIYTYSYKLCPSGMYLIPLLNISSHSLSSLFSPSQEGRTALMWACEWGHTDTAELLVKNGADTTPVNNVSDLYACYILVCVYVLVQVCR